MLRLECRQMVVSRHSTHARWLPVGHVGRPGRAAQRSRAGAVDAVLSWALDSGAARLRLAVTDCDAARPAETLYRMLGFQQTGELEPLESNPALIARVMSRSL